VRRTLIQFFLPFCFCLVPLLAAVLVAVALPEDAKRFYLKNFTLMDGLILGLGTGLFLIQMPLTWRALQWRGGGFDQRPDRWVTNLAQAAEWFPMLGLLGTVGGILQTFDQFSATSQVSPTLIIAKYAPAITATGSGLYMAFINILPPWIVLLGRDVINTLGGGSAPEESAP
jgi:hypothetical protein